MATANEIESTALRIAREAGLHLMSFFKKNITTRAKTDTSFVSEADESTETHLREALAEAFPGEAVLGEEFGLDISPEGAWWIIDPLDGTSNFLAGLPLFCVSLARMEKGRVVTAVTHNPVSGETFRATLGRGAFLGEDRLRMDPIDRGRLSLVAMRHSMMRHHPDFQDRVGTDKFRCLGSACLELGYTASGLFQASVARRIMLWDFAAGALFIQEAGGIVHTAKRQPVFPLAHPPGDYADLEIPLVTGTPRMVEILEDAVSFID